MTPQFLLLDQKEDLLLYRAAILELFLDCFGVDLDPTIWEWAYIKNPMGNPLVSLCFDDGRLIGHYAVIPYNLLHQERTLRACLSMTTMVAAAYRKYGLFTEQALQVYEKAREVGVDVVFGFPNHNSTPGFRKRLGWVLDEPDFVATLTVQDLASSGFRASLSDPDLARFDRSDFGALQWRLAKPNQEYRDFGHMITKTYQEQEDIVYCEDLNEECKNDKRRFNVLVDAKFSELKVHSIFEYQFGYRPLVDSANGLKFKKDLILSDVF